MNKLIFALLATTALAGCSSVGASSVFPPPPMSLVDPANPDIGIRDTHHHSVLGDYTHRVPLDPKPWRELNDALPPALGSK